MPTRSRPLSRRTPALLPALLLLLLAPPPAQAQWAVFDLTNHLEAIRQLRVLKAHGETLVTTLRTLERLEAETGRYRAAATRMQGWLSRGSRVFGGGRPPVEATSGADPELGALFRRAFPDAAGWDAGMHAGPGRVAELRDLAFESIVGVDRHAAQLRSARAELRTLLDGGTRDRTAAETHARSVQLHGLEIDELQNLRDIQLANLKAITTRTVYERDQARLADSLTTAALLSDSARWDRLLRSNRHWREINDPERVPLPTGSVSAAGDAGGRGPLQTFRRKPDE